MSGITDEPVVTEVKQVGDHIVVETRIYCVAGVTLLHRSLWTISTDRQQIALERFELWIGALSLNLRAGATPIEHVTTARTFAAKQFGCRVSVDTLNADTPKEVRRVFLASREGSCEVFLDEASARFWAGKASTVRNVSLRAASSALKTDEETVVESATAATRSAWIEMQVGASLLDAARHVQDRFEAAGISAATLEASSTRSG